MTRDGIGNTYSYNGEGMMTASNSAVYTLDALNQRVQNTGGSHPTETVYFGGKPIALLNPSTNAWTDLIWAGGSMIAEVPGSQTAAPVYRLLDHEGSLALAADGSGNVLGSNLYAPFGQVMASSTNDAYLYTGLFQDTEYGGDHALYRNYSTEQARWLRPDPYNGSYDPYNPQSFNRYSYVNGNPLGYTDPSGLAGGIVGGIGGGACGKKLLNLQIPIGSGGYFFNPCNPIISGASIGVTAAIKAFGWGGTASTAALEAGAAAVLAAGLTIGCSIDSDPALCGPSGWASVFIGGDAGKVVDDTLATAGATAGIWCLASGGTNSLACGFALGYAIYSIGNDVFAAIWDALGLDSPRFTGSLLPRPTDLGGLGTAPTGIPNQNLSIQGIMGHSQRGVVPSPSGESR